MATPLDFAKALLNRLGLPQTKNRLVGLVAFASIEGGHWVQKRTRFNPFNTSLSMPGATNALGQVKAYTDWPQGIEATARTIAQGNMHTILDALKADADPQDFLHSITQSQWCPEFDAKGNPTGCGDYGAFNANALYNSYANTQDSSSIAQTSSGMGWGTLVLGTLAVGTLVSLGYYYEKGHLPFMRR